jgi:hypothetical protein
MRRELMPVLPLTTVLCLGATAHAAGYGPVQALKARGGQSTPAGMTRSSR